MTRLREWMIKTTPRPWDNEEKVISGISETCIVDMAGDSLAYMGVYQQEKDDAKLICLAVNHFEAMVELLELSRYEDIRPELAGKIRAVLAEIEKEIKA